MERSFDAGELGCVRLVLALRREVDALRPGERLRVTAADPGAEIDIPAWCRMAGHRLARAEPPVFVIERAAHAGPEDPRPGC
jgi:tRNA 2-thiouridine synthesizing protein A